MSTVGDECLGLLQRAGAKIQHRGLGHGWTESTVTFVQTLQKVFQQGRKKGFGAVFGTQTPFWPFVREFSSPATVTRVRGLGKNHRFYKSGSGRDAAWIICALNNGELGIYFDVIKRNPKLVSAFYNDTPDTILTKTQTLDGIIAILDELGKINICFELDYAEYADILQGKASPIPDEETMENDAAIAVGTLTIEAGTTTAAMTPSGVELAAALHDEPESIKPTNEQETLSTENVSATIETESANEASSVPDDLFSTPSADEKELKRNEQVEVEEGSTQAPEVAKGRRKSRRELLYGVPEEEVLTIAAGQKEIQEIITQAKAKEITVLRDASSGSEYNPVLIETPEPFKSPKLIADSGSFVVVGESSLSPWKELTETSFFGIPWLVQGFEGIMDRLAEELSFVGNLLKDMLEFAAIDDGLENLTVYPEDLIAIKVTPSIIANGANRPDTFQYELRVCPTKGLTDQGGECMKCSQTISESTANLCDASGYYYCDGCFGKENIMVPARILNDWDFEERRVQHDRALQYRDHFGVTKLNVYDIAPLLVDRTPQLDAVDRLRTRINTAISYVQNCPNRGALTCSHFSRGKYTINELKKVKDDQAMDQLKEQLRDLVDHVKGECNRCRSMGRNCQICQDGDLLYLFEENVFECPKCASLVHETCVKHNKECVNCRRVYLSITSPSVDLPSMLDFVIS